MSHFTQFSVAARELCTLQCVLLDCNGTKHTGNALTIPAAACSQQLVRESSFSQVAISFLFWSFHPMIWMYLWQISLWTMLSLTCRDFQVEFWWFFLEKLCEMGRDLDSRVAPVHGKTCSISVQNIHISSGLLEMCQFPVISPTICFTWNVTFHTVLCSCTWTVHVTLCAFGLQWHKMCRKCPHHPSSCLFTTAGERIKLFTGCYFFACLVFSPYDMNVFVTDFNVCIGLSRPKHPPKVKYFFVIVACSAYWPFSSTQSEIFFQSYSLACSLCSCVCIGLWRPKHPPIVKYFLLL